MVLFKIECGFIILALILVLTWSLYSEYLKMFTQLIGMDVKGTPEMLLRAGFQTMQATWTAGQLFPDLDYIRIIGEWPKAEIRDSGAIDDCYRGIDGRSQVHGRRVIGEIHPRILH